VTTVLKLAFTGCLAIAIVSAQSRSAADHYQEALRLEEAKGDLKGAIEQYKKLATGADRAIAAKALVQLAGCYEKLGLDGAPTTYERVVREFADQP
jgi:tetratricopeptide (TPR) repeat protein